MQVHHDRHDIGYLGYAAWTGPDLCDRATNEEDGRQD